MNLNINSEILDKSGLNEDEIKMELSIALYKRGKLSLGQASNFVGMDKFAFQKELGKRGEFLNYDEEELKEDLKNLGNFDS